MAGYIKGDGLLSKIEGRRYIFWVAPRRSGKTTVIDSLISELEEQGEQAAIYAGYKKHDRPLKRGSSARFVFIDEPDHIEARIFNTIAAHPSVEHVFLIGTPYSCGFEVKNGIMRPKSLFLEIFFNTPTSRALHIWTKGSKVHSKARLKDFARALSKQEFEASMLEPYNKYRK